MIDSVELCSDLELTEIQIALTNTVGIELIEYIYSEKIFCNKGIKYFLQIKLKSMIHESTFAKIISEWIIEYYETFLISSIINERFNGYDFDQTYISEMVKRKIINTVEKNKYFVKKLTKYLKSKNQIIIEGFIKFRLNKYYNKIYSKICETLEDFYIEQDYNDFIELLSEYIRYKPSLINLLHIVTDKNDKISFFDFSGSKIELNIKNKIPQNQIENFLTMDDLLLSILIELSPRRIIWHNPCENQNINLINTIKSVFNNRFSICYSCKFCDLKKE